MDQIKAGKFIAGLRKEHGLTQEQLGERIGVTNKTVSRWENGHYMPDIATLQTLSEVFGVSIGEIIAGERLTDPQLRACSDQIILDAVANEAFSFKEKTAYWKKKWKREHLAGIAVQVLALLAAYAVIWFTEGSWRTFAAAAFPLVCCLLYACNRHRMMSYVEGKLYD